MVVWAEIVIVGYLLGQLAGGAVTQALGFLGPAVGTTPLNLRVLSEYSAVALVSEF